MAKELNTALFKHSVQIRVRTWEVDWQGIVHNSYYLRYMEIGRVEYRRVFGYDLNPDGTFNDGLKVFVVHNSIDYRAAATLDVVLNVYTRVSWIKNSSFCFEHYIEKDKTKEIIAEGKGIIVNVNPSTNIPENLADKFVNEIKNFEVNCDILR
ncbi:MAG: thioesterase family protein [Ignavibacteria bacterium]|nr:thioesterase family protein [Ignavibacteria bacterium]